MGRLDSKNAIVTGGASGIGMAIATRFAAEGAKVDILDWQQETLDQTVDNIQTAGGIAAGRVCDVGDSAAVQTSIDEIQQLRGTIDILVNNAGIANVGSALTTSAEEFERVMRVNAFGVANCLRAALSHMVTNQHGGAILNIASTVALIGIPDRFAYSASKGSVLAMTYSVAKDFVDQGIRCNAILPGRIHTPFVDGFIAQNYPGKEAEMFQKLSDFQPIGRMGTTGEIASAALFLCSDEASFVTGSAMAVDGGTMSIR